MKGLKAVYYNKRPSNNQKGVYRVENDSRSEKDVFVFLVSKTSSNLGERGEQSVQPCSRDPKTRGKRGV